LVRTELVSATERDDEQRPKDGSLHHGQRAFTIRVKTGKMFRLTFCDAALVFSSGQARVPSSKVVDGGSAALAKRAWMQG
jgi:hypothetical protein